VGGNAWLQTPPGLSQAYGGFDWELACQYAEHSVVYRLVRGGRAEFYLKLAPTGHYPSLAAEADRMRWARDRLPVPEVVDQGSEGFVSWLATTPLAGRDGTSPELLGRPRELTQTLARGLRHFHETAPVATCPFDFRLDRALEHVRGRLSAGLIAQGRDFHPEFRHLTPEGAVAQLESTRPPSEDLVVCHGDYCPPNILIQDGTATGYLDLGELGVADRWWDLATATWSLEWNLGPGFEDLFLEEYGVTADHDRIPFYRLMYDLVC